MKSSSIPKGGRWARTYKLVIKDSRLSHCIRDENDPSMKEMLGPFHHYHARRALGQQQVPQNAWHPANTSTGGVDGKNSIPICSSQICKHLPVLEVITPEHQSEVCLDHPESPRKSMLRMMPVREMWGYGGPNHMILALRDTRRSMWNRARYRVHHWGARGMLSSAAPPKAPPDLFSPFRNKDILPYSQPDPSFENEFLIPWQNRESFSSCHELSLYIRAFLLCASCWVWGYSGRRFLKFCVHCFSLFWWQNCHSRVGWIHKMICPRLILMQYAETEAEQFKWSWFYNLLFLAKVLQNQWDFSHKQNCLLTKRLNPVSSKSGKFLWIEWCSLIYYPNCGAIIIMCMSAPASLHHAVNLRSNPAFQRIQQADTLHPLVCFTCISIFQWLIPLH